MAEPSEEEQKQFLGELKARLQYLADSGEGNAIRQEVYLQARAGTLTTEHIELLKYLRDAENKLQK